MTAEQWEQRLCKAAEQLPDGAPLFHTAREHALHAAAIVGDSLRTDPTLLDYDRGGRDLDVLAELLRQLRGLAKQVEMMLKHKHLVDTSARRIEFALLGKVNACATEEFEALAAHLAVLAQRIADKAQSDWNTPQRIRERSEQRLPDPERFLELADQIYEAVRPALELEYPAAAAVQAARLAEQLRVIAGDRVSRCAGPGCEHPLRPAGGGPGRPRVYCGSTCRQRARRAARTS